MSTLEELSELSDQELRSQLKSYGKNVGPITSDTIRRVLLKKLHTFVNPEAAKAAKPKKSKAPKQSEKISSTVRRSPRNKNASQLEDCEPATQPAKQTRAKTNQKAKQKPVSRPKATPKKQPPVDLTAVKNLSDHDLRAKCIECGLKPGPVTGTTRGIWEKRLAKKLQESPAEIPQTPSPEPADEANSQPDTEECIAELSLAETTSDDDYQEAVEMSIQTDPQNDTSIFNSTFGDNSTFNDGQRNSGWEMLEDMDVDSDPETGLYITTQQIIDEVDSQCFDNFTQKRGRRPIVIDGCNIAGAHGKGKYFSFKGIKIVYDHFVNLGHEEVFVIIPHGRTSPTFRGSQKNPMPTRNFEILQDLEELNAISVAPARQLGSRGPYIASYDDRLIIQLASRTGGIVVTTDMYRDLYDEAMRVNDADTLDVIRYRILNFMFANDHFMPIDDPEGRYSATRLDDFLRF